MTNKSNVQFVRKVRAKKPKTTTHKKRTKRKIGVVDIQKQRKFIDNYILRYNAIKDGTYDRKVGYNNFPDLFSLDKELKELGFNEKQRNYFWDDINKNQTAARPDNVWSTLQKYSNLISNKE